MSLELEEQVDLLINHNTELEQRLSKVQSIFLNLFELTEEEGWFIEDEQDSYAEAYQLERQIRGLEQW